MEPKPLFDVKYWEDAYRFLQKIDEAGKSSVSCPLKPSDSAPLC